MPRAKEQPVQRTFRPGQDVCGATVIFLVTIANLKDKVQLACPRCDQAFGCPYDAILAKQIEIYGKTNPDKLVCPSCQKILDVMEEVERTKHLHLVPNHLFQKGREKEPQSEKAKLCVSVMSAGGTLEQKAALISLAARRAGVAISTAEKFFFRWIVYPYALRAEAHFIKDAAEKKS